MAKLHMCFIPDCGVCSTLPLLVLSALPCPALPLLALPLPVLSCPALSCLSCLPYPVLPQLFDLTCLSESGVALRQHFTPSQHVHARTAVMIINKGALHCECMCKTRCLCIMQVASYNGVMLLSSEETGGIFVNSRKCVCDISHFTEP